MDRATFGNFEQPFPLRIVQVAAQFDFTIDAVQKTLLCFAVPAILSMNAEMLEPDDDTLQIHALPLRIQPQGHRRARSQTSKQEFIRRRSCVVSKRRWFICSPAVTACNDF